MWTAAKSYYQPYPPTLPTVSTEDVNFPLEPCELLSLPPERETPLEIAFFVVVLGLVNLCSNSSPSSWVPALLLATTAGRLSALLSVPSSSCCFWGRRGAGEDSVTLYRNLGRAIGSQLVIVKLWEFCLRSQQYYSTINAILTPATPSFMVIEVTWTKYECAGWPRGRGTMNGFVAVHT